MKANDIKIGTKVIYHSIIGGKEGREATITSEVFEIGGTQCCMIDIISGCVAIEALTKA